MIFQYRFFFATVGADGSVKLIDPHLVDVPERELVTEERCDSAVDQLLVSVICGLLYIRFFDIEQPAVKKIQKGTALRGEYPTALFSCCS